MAGSEKVPGSDRVLLCAEKTSFSETCGSTVNKLKLKKKVTSERKHLFIENYPIVLLCQTDIICKITTYVLGIELPAD